MSSVGLADHYGILELYENGRETDEATIKKAYKRLVLQWHPDKHLANREVAEEKIRAINDAYETLSNPFKRSQYDQQLLALERKARGFRLDTSAIKPRMSIPKEFMLSPMGHPEKFVRVSGMSLFVQSRKDLKIDFYDFFREAKFSLWWLPEVNNMCRLRPTTTAGVGQDGGMNFSFALHRTVNTSEVNLSPGTWGESANVIAVASPIFARAFRFEAAHFPGHYLAYKPPTHLRMVGGLVEETTAIDFNLVDYVQMYNYITLEEVLRPAVKSMRGDKEFLKLDAIRDHSDVDAYFKKVLKQATTWPDEDFETFFASRSDEWEYDREKSSVRLRSKVEQLSNTLRRCKKIVEVAAAVSGAADYDVLHLPLETLEHLLDGFHLASKLPPPDVSAAIHMLDAQKKVLVALPRACEKEAPFRRLLSIYERVVVFCGECPEASIVKWRGETANDLAELVSEQIKRRTVKAEITLPVLVALCEMPLAWRSCADKLASIAASLLEEQTLDLLLPLLRVLVRSLPDSQPVAECVARLARNQLPRSSPESAAEVLDVMVAGGICLDFVPMLTCGLLKMAPLGTIASIVAGLGDRGFEGDDMVECSKFLGAAASELEALPPAVLLRLTVAATKSGAVASGTLDAVASVVALTLHSWSLDDASKLLLALARAKATDAAGEGVVALYARAAEVLSPKTAELSAGQLIKIVLAIGKAAHCRPLLDAVLNELIANRLRELPPAQLLLLTQGVLGSLGGEHASVVRILDFWAAAFNEAQRLESLLSPELIKDRRKKLEADGQLNADQLAKLAVMLVTGAPGHGAFWKALARRFVGEDEIVGLAESLTPAGRASIEAAFAPGQGALFPERKQFLKAVRGEKEKEKEKGSEKHREKEAQGARSDRQEKDKLKDKDPNRTLADKKARRDQSQAKSESEQNKRRKKEKDKEKDRDKDEKRRKRAKDHDDKEPPASLLLAAEAGTPEECASLLGAGAALEEESPEGLRALHLAARRGSLELCEALLRARAEANARGAGHWSPLHFASNAGSATICQVLLEAKAEVNAQNEDGGTALHIATAAGDSAAIAVLVQGKASATIKDGKGQTPMDIMKAAEDREREAEEKRREFLEAQQSRRRLLKERRDRIRDDSKQKQEAEAARRQQLRQRRQKLKADAVVELDDDEDSFDLVADEPPAESSSIPAAGVAPRPKSQKQVNPLGFDCDAGGIDVDGVSIVRTPDARGRGHRAGFKSVVELKDDDEEVKPAVPKAASASRSAIVALD